MKSNLTYATLVAYREKRPLSIFKFQFSYLALSLGLLLFTNANLSAQTVLATEDFDGGGVGYTTTVEFTTNGNSHFDDTDGTSISNVSAPYSFEGGGNIFWAAENVDDPGGNGASEQRLATNDFSITGYTDITVCIDMAAGNNGLGNLGTYDQSDYVIVQYNTDIQPLYRDALNFKWSPNPFDPTDLFNQPLHHDVNRDGDGSDGPQITTTAQNFCYTIPNIHTTDVSAALMSIRMLVRMDANSEEIAFDNIVVTGTLPPDTSPPTSACPDPFIATADLCPRGFGPSTPSGNWGTIPASGMKTLQVGTNFTFDLNCLSDDTDVVGDLEIRLASSTLVSPIGQTCTFIIDNTYDVRDVAGNIAPDLITIRYTLQDVEAPVSTCASPITVTLSTLTDGVSCPSDIPGGGVTVDPSPNSMGMLTIRAGGTPVEIDVNCVQDFPLTSLPSSCHDIDDLIFTLSSSILTGTACNSVFSLVLNVADPCGNVAPGLIEVDLNIVDNTPPTIACPATTSVEVLGSDLGFTCPSDISVSVSVTPNPTSGMITYTYDGIDVPLDVSCVMDNCSAMGDLVFQTAGTSTLSTGCNLTIQQNFTVQDACGNSAMDILTYEISFISDTPPTITNAGAHECGETFTMQSQMDYIFTVDPPSNGVSSNQDCRSAVIWTTPVLTAACGIVDSVSIVFSAESSPAPNMIPSTLNYSTSLGNMNWFLGKLITESTYFHGSTESCSATTRATYYVYDECGNESTCFNFFEVTDNQPPVPTCNDIEIDLSGAPSYTLTPADIDAIGAGTTDNCGLAMVPFSVTPNTFTTADIGDNIVSFTATDRCGNSTACSATVTVLCMLEVDCSNIFDQTLSCRADLPPVDFDLPIIIDSCGNITHSALTIIPGNTGCPGDELTITRSYYTQDDAGNRDTCMQTFTVVSNVVPTIVCPAGGIIECEADLPLVSSTDAMATVECGTPMVAVTGPVVDGDPNCPTTTYTYTYTVTDACNRTADCARVFTVANDPPTIVCPADMGIECAADIVVDVTLPVVTSSCAPGVVTAVGPTLIAGQADCPGGTYTVEYTVTDICMRTATCTQTFVIQNDGPAIACPAGFIVECADDIMVDPSDATVTTSCMLGFNVLITGPKILNGDPDCPGTTYTYFYVVQDDCGRQAQCDRTFTIQNTGPTVICPADAIVECVADITPDFDLLVTTSSCGAALKFLVDGPNLTSGQSGCSGATYDLVYTVTDPCGRSASCTQTFTLENIGPVITAVPLNRNVLCSSDIESEEDQFIYEVSCDLGATLTVGPVTAQDGLGDCPGAQYTITYSVMDVCGRSAAYTQTFTVENNAPRVYPDEDQYVSCREDINPRWETAFVETDCNLGIVRYEIIGPIEDESEPDCNGKVINYLYSVWDACGRMTCVAQAWTIQNNGPVFDNAPGDVTVDCTDVPDGLDVTASFDACGNVSVMISETTTPSSGNNYRLNRIYTATDDCGNSVSHDQRITVLCPTPPSSVEYCTETEYFWGNAWRSRENGDLARDILGSFNLSANPLVLGVPERSLTINSRQCLLRLLPSRGAVSAFPVNTGDVVLSTNCDPAPIGIDAKGRVMNRLAGQVATLMLNERLDSKLTQLVLDEICLDFPEATLLTLPQNANIGHLRDLGNAGLGGVYTESLTDLHASIKLVNTYFVGCRVATCETYTGAATERTESTKMDQSIKVLQVQPNPATTEVLLTYQMAGEDLAVKVFSSNGQLMYQNQRAGEEVLQTERVDVSTWPKGFYFVTVTNGEEVLTEKIIKL